MGETLYIYTLGVLILMLVTAEGFFRQSLSLSESIEHRWGIAQSYEGLGEVTLAGGDCPAAQT